MTKCGIALLAFSYYIFFQFFLYACNEILVIFGMRAGAYHVTHFAPSEEKQCETWIIYTL